MSSDSPDGTTPQELRLIIYYRDPLEVQTVPFSALPGMGLDVPLDGRQVARIQIQVMPPGSARTVAGTVVTDSGEITA